MSGENKEESVSEEKVVTMKELEEAATAEIERRFRINEELLRFVTIKYDSKREVKAWNDLVAKANKPAEKPEEKAEEKAAEPAAEEAASESAAS